MKKSIYTNYIKTFIDYFVSTILIVILCPIFVLIFLLQVIFNGFPIFFIQKRIGKNNQIFKLIKFRTMKNTKGKNGMLLKDENRKTFFGEILRKTSFDELPSLINVLRGEMSLIGPRPLLVEYLKLYSKDQLKRHLVKPGLTGLAQINGRNAISWTTKFNFDLEYVNNISFKLDIKIFLKTILMVLLRKNIYSTSDYTMEKFDGKN